MCVESESFLNQKELDKMGFRIWPMIRSFITTSDNTYNTNSSSRNVVEKTDGGCYVLFACTPQREKGFDIALEAISKLNAASKINPMLRVTKHLDNNKPLKSEYERILKLSEVKPMIFEGDLSPEEYEKMYEMADIVVVPYRRDLFEFKTSGAILDSVFYGKPMLATDKTRPGDVVQKYSIGSTFDDGDSNSLLDRLNDLISRYSAVKNLVDDKRDTILLDFNPSYLVNFIES